MFGPVRGRRAPSVVQQPWASHGPSTVGRSMRTGGGRVPGVVGACIGPDGGAPVYMITLPPGRRLGQS